MKKIFRQKIILLKSYKYGESDLILHGLSADFGRLSLLAKGALRSKKRFGGGVLEPTHYIEAEFQSSCSDPTEKMAFLNEARLVEGFLGLRTDYDRLQGAFYMLSQVDRLSQPGFADPKQVFDLLGHSLRTLEKSEEIERLLAFFDLKLIHSQGILPHDWQEKSWLGNSIKDYLNFSVPNDKISVLRRKYQLVIDDYFGRSEY